MGDKFLEYYQNDEKRIQKLSEYVHLNFKMIMTKMQSEMRRKLDIAPSHDNDEGYWSLMMTLQGRLFNEMVYSMSGACQTTNLNIYEIVPKSTLLILLDLMKGINPLNGSIRTDVKEDKEAFNEYYLSQIDELRNNLEALPKQ